MWKMPRMSFALHERRHHARLGSLDLARVLPKLRRHPGQAQGRENVLLACAGDEDIVAEEAILVHLDAELFRAAPHGHVVLLASREVVQGEGEFLRGDDPQIGVDPGS